MAIKLSQKTVAFLRVNHIISFDGDIIDAGPAKSKELNSKFKKIVAKEKRALLDGAEWVATESGLHYVVSEAEIGTTFAWKEIFSLSITKRGQKNSKINLMVMEASAYDISPKMTDLRLGSEDADRLLQIYAMYKPNISFD